MDRNRPTKQAGNDREILAFLACSIFIMCLGGLQYPPLLCYNAHDNKKGFTGASTMREHLDVSKAKSEFSPPGGGLE